MDNELLFSLTSDGKTLKTGAAWGHPKDLLNGTPYAIKEPIPITHEIRNFKVGEQTLNIQYKAKIYSHVSSAISEEIWSNQHQTLFFIERKSQNAASSRVGYWNVQRGFGFISEYKPGLALSTGLSSDEKNLVTLLNDSDGEQTHILISSIKTKQERVISSPQWAKRCVMLANGIFFFFRHDSGNYGQIYLWDSSKVQEPKAINIKGDIIDALAFNGHVWGLRKSETNPHLVRLGPTGTTVEEDLGPIPDL